MSEIQTQIDSGKNYLEHAGVKGMKWGVRKQAKSDARAERGNSTLSKMREKDPKKTIGEARNHHLATSIGRQFAISAGTGILASSINKASPKVALGVNVVGNLAAWGVLAKDIHTGVGLREVDRRSRG